MVTTYTASIVYNGIIFHKQPHISHRFANHQTTRVTEDGELLRKIRRASANSSLLQAGGSTSHATAVPNESRQTASRIPLAETLEPTKKLNKKEILRRLHAWHKTEDARKYLHFVTVTFPLKLKDNLAYKYFNTWLTKLRKERIINNYLWVAERQQNSTIHFHIILSNYVNIRQYNDLMKETLTTGLNKREYHYDRRKIENFNGVDLLKDRQTKKVVNLATIRDFKKVFSYVAKYTTKNNTTMYRQPWHCSRLLSNLCTKVNITEAELIAITDTHHEEMKIVFENEYIRFISAPPHAIEYFINLLAEVNHTIEQIDYLAFTEPHITIIEELDYPPEWN